MDDIYTPWDTFDAFLMDNFGWPSFRSPVSVTVLRSAFHVHDVGCTLHLLKALKSEYHDFVEECLHPISWRMCGER